MRFDTLDAWRGICALLVAMMHFPASGPISESPFIHGAFLFVDYFFVLSGFVIAHGYGQKIGDGTGFARFATLRFFRIYPLHLAVLAAFVAFEAARWAVPALRGTGDAPFTGGNDIPALLSSIALLNGVGVETALTWNGPSWSISAEFWTYLVFGIAVMLFAGRAWIALVPIVLAGPILLYFYSPDFMDATWDLGLIRCLYGFALGALLYWSSRRWLATGATQTPSVAFWTAAEIVAVIAVVAFVTLAADNAAGLFAPFLFVAVVLVFARGAGLVSIVLRTRAFLLLGALSYGIYMVHIFVQGRLINAGTIFGKVYGVDLVGPYESNGRALHGFGLQGDLFGTLMLAVMVVLVVAAAWLGNVLIEKPFQRWSRKLVANDTGATAGRVRPRAAGPLPQPR
jgi:peptidoglycan/LPS O-acetylase OafA/YrhL